MIVPIWSKLFELCLANALLYQEKPEVKHFTVTRLPTGLMLEALPPAQRLKDGRQGPGRGRWIRVVQAKG